MSVTQARRPNAVGQRRAGYRPDLEGLRGIAVLVVVLYHAGLPGIGGGFVGVDVFFVLSGFLITGLLWRGRQESGRWRLADFYGRRIRRLLPVSVLVLAVTTVVGVLVLPPLQGRSLLLDARWTALYTVNYRFAVQGTDYLTASAPPSPLQHYWSLAVEEQFYLLWPMLLVGAVLLGRRHGRAVSVVAMTAVAVSSFMVARNWTGVAPAWAFFSLPSRAWELAVGGVLALTAHWIPRRPAIVVLGWLGLGSIGLACLFIGASTPYPGTAALLPVLGTVAVIAAGVKPAEPGRNWSAGRVLSAAPLTAMGRLSYSWYLWHWPVLILGTVILGPAVDFGDRVLLVAIGLLLSMATHGLVENPCRYSTRWQMPRRAAVWALALTSLSVVATLLITSALPPDRGTGTAAAVAFAPATASSPAAGAHGSVPGAHPGPTGRLASGNPTVTASPTTAGARSTAPASARATATTAAAPPAPLVAEGRQAAQFISTALSQNQVPANLTPPLDEPDLDEASPFFNGCLLSWTVTVQPDCVSARQDAKKSMVLFGDSHAAQWYPAVNQVAKERGWALRTYTKTTCPPLDLSVFSPYLDREYTECENWRQDILARIAADPPTLVVLGIARHYSDAYHFLPYDKSWLSGMATMIKKLRATGAKVLILGPVPKPPADVPTCLSAHLTTESVCDFTRAPSLSEAGVHREKAVAQSSGASYLDLTPFMCDAKACPVILGHNLIYRDDNHLTGGFAKLLIPILSAEVQAVIPT